MQRGNVFWGFVIFLAGILLLLNTLGIVTFNFWQVIGPLFLILLGAWFLLGPVFFKRELKEEPISIPLEGVSQARIEINHGAGKLEIGASDQSDTLIEGSCVGGVEQHLERNSVQTRLKLRSPETIFFGFPMNVAPGGLLWKLYLNPTIPLILIFKTGASESKIDLTYLKVNVLEIQTGASATALILPENAGFTRVKIESGVASLNIRVPLGVAAHIESQSGIANISIDSTRFVRIGKGYESSDYATAINKAEIFIQTGLGAVEIR